VKHLRKRWEDVHRPKFHEGGRLYAEGILGAAADAKAAKMKAAPYVKALGSSNDTHSLRQYVSYAMLLLDKYKTPGKVIAAVEKEYKYVSAYAIKQMGMGLGQRKQAAKKKTAKQTRLSPKQAKAAKAAGITPAQALAFINGSK
jgi:hypothetical protein